jgi:indolepyruvate ferredoxin oxidoreductase, beta subunit
MNLEIVCAGIGGRGVLLASTIIIETAVRAGYHAMASDEYGMSQRGGSVVSLVKIGTSQSPLIGRENADILLAFEESEFYRNLVFLKKGGMAIINTPKDTLPEKINNLLAERDSKSFLIAADDIAKEKGMVQASNMALLGFFSSFKVGPYTSEGVLNTLKERTKGKFLDKNVDIFQTGYKNAAHKGVRIKAQN